MSHFVKQKAFIANEILLIKMKQGYFLMMYSDGIMCFNNDDLVALLNKAATAKIIQESNSDEEGRKMLLFSIGPEKSLLQENDTFLTEDNSLLQVIFNQDGTTHKAFYYESPKKKLQRYLNSLYPKQNIRDDRSTGSYNGDD